VGTSGVVLRTFVAVELPEDALAAVGSAQRALASRLPSRALRWTRPEGIHLTLKFLGDTPADAVPEIGRRLGNALSGLPGFSLSLAALGVFPSTQAPRVVWIGLSGDLPSLLEAQRRVEAAISTLGYPTERRPFSPHLTLARVADIASPSESREIGAVVEVAAPPPQVRFGVGEVCLIRSELGPGGARYSRLAAVPLA